MRRIFVLTLMGLACHVYSQFSISGNVRDNNGRPLTGANVVIKNTLKGSTTDQSGKYELKNIKPGTYTLSASFIGYEENEITLSITKNQTIDFLLDISNNISEEVIIKGVRAGKNTPTTYSYVDKEAIADDNLGKDVPYLLALQPSVNVSSDAGTGIGYTSLRIRGVDSRQINVTINGIPLNDAESHGVYWVDIPDITGSTESIQIQRGVGTSTNGAGAFGGSINLNTDNISKTAQIQIDASSGTFNTRKYALSAKTGLIKDHYFLEGKFGQTQSDGYRDRAWSDLTSYFVQTGYMNEKSIIKLLAFGGREETYQAWYSVTQEELDYYGRTFNPAGIIYNEDWSIGSYYDNFIDHYEQDHLQLHWIQQFSPNLSFSSALHYTYGRGYYEEYMQEELLQYYPLSYYNLQPLYFGLDSVNTGNGYDYFYHDTINYSNVVRRLWLDNDFYGATWNLNFNQNNWDVNFGGAYNLYTDGQHFGEVIWANYALNSLPGHQFYNNVSEKSDFNTYLKTSYQISGLLNLYADLQFRNIHYTAEGTNKEWTDGTINIDKSYQFFNPKFGALMNLSDDIQIYASYAIANREPNRSDFLDAPNGIEPKPEKLADIESGIKYSSELLKADAVLYNMNYTNQLVMTGKLNDVGSPIRKNVGESYRRGIEFSAIAQPINMVNIGGNLSLSSNQTTYKEYDEITSSFIDYKNVSLAYSPSILANGIFGIRPIANLEINLLYKYVGEQFVDNTENEMYSLPSYNTIDVQINYEFTIVDNTKIKAFYNIYNLGNKQYSSYGTIHWTGALGLFPQAGRHNILGLSIAL